MLDQDQVLAIRDGSDWYPGVITAIGDHNKRTVIFAGEDNTPYTYTLIGSNMWKKGLPILDGMWVPIQLPEPTAA
jgi:hypothetical protein